MAKARKFRKRRSMSVSFDERLLLTSLDLKSLIMANTEDRCQLPSCYRKREAQELSKHHWNYRGRAEDPLFFPKAIHLLCPSCHDRVHKVSGIIVLQLETSDFMVKDLIWKVSRILREPCKNVRFVLTKELSRAGIVKIEKGKYKLMTEEKQRIQKIKEYIKINSPGFLKNVHRAMLRD